MANAVKSISLVQAYYSQFLIVRSLTFGVAAVALRDIGLRDAEEPEIYEAATAQEVIIMTAERTLRDLR